jgi:hypothetical protein
MDRMGDITGRPNRSICLREANLRIGSETRIEIVVSESNVGPIDKI